MSPARTLEDGYRRLLALYPAEHRAAHEEEMLGVLMTAAAPGQRRPRLAESAALIRGAVRIRLRPGRAAPYRYWQDALATVSVALPLLMLPFWPFGQLPMLFSTPQFSGPPFHSQLVLVTFAIETARISGPWLVLAVLTLLRLRRTAAVVAVLALTTSTISVAPTTNLGFTEPSSMLYVVVFGLEVVALLASPGPRRGREILGWRHGALAVLTAAVLGWADFWLSQAHRGLAAVIVIMIIAGGLAGLAAASPVGRRSLVLLLIPAYYLVLSLVLPQSELSLAQVPGWEAPLRITLTCAPLVAIASVAIIMTVRYIRRPRPRPAAPAGPQPPMIT